MQYIWRYYASIPLPDQGLFLVLVNSSLPDPIDGRSANQIKILTSRLWSVIMFLVILPGTLPPPAS